MDEKRNKESGNDKPVLVGEIVGECTQTLPFFVV